eukprot:6202968-Amphidinium_carterae.2
MLRRRGLSLKGAQTISIVLVGGLEHIVGNILKGAMSGSWFQQNWGTKSPLKVRDVLQDLAPERGGL